MTLKNGIILHVTTVKKACATLTTTVHITTEFITLTQLLKEENIISSGGQAKYYLMDHPVLLNGEPENRRGKKLYDHDEIEIEGERYLIELAENVDELIAEADAQKAARAVNAKKPFEMIVSKRRKRLPPKHVKKPALQICAEKIKHVQADLVDQNAIIQRDHLHGTRVANP